MNIVYPVIVAGIIVAIIATAVLLNQDTGPTKTEEDLNNETAEIEKKIDEIEKNNDENDYKPKPREWITSGPFQIDRSEYILGEKIFLRIGGLNSNEKGEVIFHSPVKSVDGSIYIKVPFDGANKPALNYYVEPQLSAARGFCTADDFIGEWTVTFYGTSYEPIKFNITEEILPGEKEDYQPVC